MSYIPQSFLIYGIQNPAIVAEKSNLILLAIVQSLREEETVFEVKHAAAKALESALEFAKENFAKQVFLPTKKKKKKKKSKGGSCTGFFFLLLSLSTFFYVLFLQEGEI